MASRLTRYPSGLDVDETIVLELQTSEPSSVLFSDGTAYNTKITAGGTRGSFWLESDGLHFNIGGGDKLVPTIAAGSVPSLGNAYIAGQTITANAGAIAISDTSTGSTNTLTLSNSGTNTGNTIGIDLDASVGGRAVYIDAGAGARTAALAKVKLDGTFSSASGGTVLDIDVSQTGAAASSLFDIDVASIYTGSIFDVAIGAAATTGYVINADLNLGVAYGFMNIDCGAVTRTADVIDVTFDGDGNISLMDINHSNTGTADLLDIDVSGIGSGNILDITYSAASTGNAIDLNMANNVAGNAIDIASAGTGDGCVLNVAHTGALASGSAAVKISSTGNYANADGNTVEIRQLTGAGQVGNYALYISALGTNVEGLKVDAGGVVFDETLSVGGATTITGALTVGVDDTGHDVKFYGSTASAYMLWDESADDLVLAGAAGLVVAGGSSLASLTVTGASTLTGLATLTAGLIGGTATLSGPGAISVVKMTTKVTTTGVNDALTLADGVDGQIITIIHDVDGGDFILTPTTPIGYATITSDTAGDTVMLQFATTRGWFIIGGFGYATT